MERSFSEETMLASLHDIRLPADASGGVFAELLVAIGLAALAALLCVALLRSVFARVPKARASTLADEVARVQGLPVAARRIAQLHLLRDHAPERYQSLSAALYAPGALDDAALDQEVSRLVRAG